MNVRNSSYSDAPKKRKLYKIRLQGGQIIVPSFDSHADQTDFINSLKGAVNSSETQAKVFKSLGIGISGLAALNGALSCGDIIDNTGEENYTGISSPLRVKHDVNSMYASGAIIICGFILLALAAHKRKISKIMKNKLLLVKQKLIPLDSGPHLGFTV